MYIVIVSGIVSLNSIVFGQIQLLKQGFIYYKPYYTYSITSKNVYAEIVFFFK